MAEARRVVDALGLDLEWTELPWGSAYYHEHGRMMSEDWQDVLRAHDAVLMGADRRSERPRSRLAVGLDPADPAGARPLGERPAGAAAAGDPVPARGRGPDDVDMLFVRENTEGEYAGVGGRSHRGLPLEVGIETSVFTRTGVERVVRHAFELATGPQGRADERDEVERLALRLRALGRGGGGGARRLPRGARRARARRRARGAHGAEPGEPRRRRRLEPVRRHPHRPRGRDPGRHGDGRLGQHRARHRRPRAVRAGARLGPRHRRAGHRQPRRRDLERVADARLPRRDRRRRAA